MSIIVVATSFGKSGDGKYIPSADDLRKRDPDADHQVTLLHEIRSEVDEATHRQLSALAYHCGLDGSDVLIGDLDEHVEMAVREVSRGAER